MILGTACTRNCGFCGVSHSAPERPDPEEPGRVGQAVKRLGLTYVVITSVTRDDLEDGGASHFAKTVKEIRKQSPETRIETLIPDFAGSASALGLVIDAAPDVISHNMETVRSLYDKVRPEADYDRSLEVLYRVAQSSEKIEETQGTSPFVLASGGENTKASGGENTKASSGENIKASNGENTKANKRKNTKAKSGLMVGVGETAEQVLELMDDLIKAGCSILTIGQYLRPSLENIPVEEYIRPEQFDLWAEQAKSKGFEFAFSAPFVRSSYHAEEALP
jgi:lipoic acid synthetase